MGDTCTLTATLVGGDNSPLAGIKVKLSLKSAGHLYFSDHRIVDRTPLEVLTDGSGAFSEPVVRNDQVGPHESRWVVECPDASFTKEINVNADSLDVIAAPSDPIP